MTWHLYSENIKRKKERKKETQKHVQIGLDIEIITQDEMTVSDFDCCQFDYYCCSCFSVLSLLNPPVRSSIE